MGTEVELSCNSLRLQIENEKTSLSKIDENIKKNQSARRYQESYFNNNSEVNRAGARLGRNNFQDPRNVKLEEERNVKRKQETKTVFSRLSSRKMDIEADEAEFETKRPRISSQVTRDLPTKQEVMKAQQTDEVSKGRNRRMFNSLLGTLQKFKQEEITLKTKEDKKAQVEKKIELQAKEQREMEKKERQNLFQERDRKKATIKALEIKMTRLEEFEHWESNYKLLCHHILTKSKPHIYWMPKKMNDRANEKLEHSQKHHEKILDRKRKDLQKELEFIEEKCLRNVKGFLRRPNVYNDLATIDPDTPMENMVIHNIKIEDKENEEVEHSHRGKFRRSEDDGVEPKEGGGSDEDMEADIHDNDVERPDLNGNASPMPYENGEGKIEKGDKENELNKSTQDVNMTHDDAKDASAGHSTPSPGHSSPSPTHTMPSPARPTPSPVHTIPSPAHTLPSPAHSSRSPVHNIPSPIHTIPSPVHTIPSPDHTPNTRKNRQGYIDDK